MQRSKAFDFTREVTLILIFAAVVLTLPIWLPMLGGYEALATKIVIWGIFALGFDILLGFTGYLSFGHAAFFGVSAYTTGLMLKHFSNDIIPAMAVSFVVGTIVAVVIGYITLRRSGIYFSILTLAFAQMLHAIALSTAQRWTGGDNGLTMDAKPSILGLDMSASIDIATPVFAQGVAGAELNYNVMFLFASILLIGGFIVARQIKRSPFGLMLMSIKENPMRLEYTGVNVWRYKMMAYIISAMYAGLAGSLMVIYEPYVATEYLHWSTSGEVVIMSVLGGVNTLIGPIIGAAFMLYFENVVQAWIGEQWHLVLGLIFVAVVIFLPGGFVDGWRRILRAIGLGGKRHRRENVPDAPTSDNADAQRRANINDAAAN